MTQGDLDYAVELLVDLTGIETSAEACCEMDDRILRSHAVFVRESIGDLVNPVPVV